MQIFIICGFERRSWPVCSLHRANLAVIMMRRCAAAAAAVASCCRGNNVTWRKGERCRICGGGAHNARYHRRAPTIQPPAHRHHPATAVVTGGSRIGPTEDLEDYVNSYLSLRNASHNVLLTNRSLHVFRQVRIIQLIIVCELRLRISGVGDKYRENLNAWKFYEICSKHV